MVFRGLLLPCSSNESMTGRRRRRRGGMQGGSDRSAENKTEVFLLYIFIIDFLEYLIRFGQSLHPTVK